MLSVDGGHCALWLEPAVTLRALFPAPWLVMVVMWLNMYTLEIYHQSIPSFSFVEFGFAVFGWPRSRFWKGVPSPGSVPAVANSNPQSFSPGSGSGACDHAIGNLQAFQGGTCCVHELHDFLKIKRRDESCSSLMGNSSFQDLEVPGS